MFLISFFLFLPYSFHSFICLAILSLSLFMFFPIFFFFDHGFFSFSFFPECVFPFHSLFFFTSTRWYSESVLPSPFPFFISILALILSFVPLFLFFRLQLILPFLHLFVHCFLTFIFISWILERQQSFILRRSMVKINLMAKSQTGSEVISQDNVCVLVLLSVIFIQLSNSV